MNFVLKSFKPSAVRQCARLPPRRRGPRLAHADLLRSSHPGFLLPLLLAAACCISGCGNSDGSKTGTARAAIQQLGSGNASEQLRAIRDLEALDGSAEHDIIEALRTGTIEQRVRLAEVVGMIPGMTGALLDPLLSMTMSADSRARGIALQALLRFRGDRRVSRRYIELLGDTDGLVRGSAADTIRNLAVSDAKWLSESVEPLEHCVIQDADRAVRSICAQALVTLARLDVSARSAVERGLASSQAGLFTDGILRSPSDWTFEAASGVVAAIRKIVSNRHTPALERAQALAALGTLGSASRVATIEIRDGLEDTDIGVVLAACRVVEQLALADDEIVKRLQELTRSLDEDKRKAAGDALQALARKGAR